MNNVPADRHILFVTGEYPPMTGGVGAYTERLALALVDLGWQASVVTTTNLPQGGNPTAVAVYPIIRRWDWRIWKAEQNRPYTTPM